MSNPHSKTLITRTELARIAGVSHQRISQMKFLPNPVRKEGTVLLFDREQALANWRQRVEHKQRAINKMTTSCLDAAQRISFVAFMKGDFDRAEQKQRYQLKKLASKHTKPKTTTVQLIDEWHLREKSHRY